MCARAAVCMHSSIIICHFFFFVLSNIRNDALLKYFRLSFSVIHSFAEIEKNSCWILMKHIRLAHCTMCAVRHQHCYVMRNEKKEPKLAFSIIWFANKLFNKNCWNCLICISLMRPITLSLWNNELSETFQLNWNKFVYRWLLLRSLWLILARFPIERDTTGGRMM